MCEKFRGILDRNLIVQDRLRAESQRSNLCSISADPEKGGVNDRTRNVQNSLTKQI